ncbi:YkvA family protein [Streptococcus mitis]
MSNNLSEDQVKGALESGYGQSEALLNDKDELDNFLQRLEQKINDMPFVGKKFSMIPVMISLVKNYVQGKYTTVPYGTILAVLSALVYFLSPIDIIPDFIPLAGYLDDMAVVGLCMNMVSIDIETYEKWRQAQGLI